METRTADLIASLCGGNLVAGSGTVPIRRVCTDSRHARAGDLFVPLSGKRFDAHQFLPEVAGRNIAAVLMGRSKPIPAALTCPVIVVDDPRRALGKLAAAYRRDFAVPIVVVGGSNGKTTVKELIASVLRQKLSTLWSEASFNNDIGVPLTLLRLERSHEAAVLEAGTNHPGELEPLMRMIQPRYGVITNIGREHLEFFGDLAGVAAEEGALAERLPGNGKLFIHGDSEWTAPIAARTKAAVVRLGTGERNDWRGTWLRTEKSGVVFRIDGPDAKFVGEYRVNLLGRHQVVNALFGMAVGMELGLDRAQIERGLAECHPARMRLQLCEVNGVRVLDDAYNANADSMRVALETLQDLPCKGRRVAVLGDMGELGTHVEAAHQEVGRLAAQSGVAQLFAVGAMASATATGAREAGLTRVFEFQDVETAGSAVKQFLKAGDLVLLKASRAARLERIADILKSA